MTTRYIGFYLQILKHIYKREEGRNAGQGSEMGDSDAPQYNLIDMLFLSGIPTGGNITANNAYKMAGNPEIHGS